jgi:GH15 family glucan-1,4-alpha-glucosidase
MNGEMHTERAGDETMGRLSLNENRGDGAHAASETRSLRESIEEYLLRRGVAEYCSVEVQRSGDWFELNGRVDSHWTRAVLFSMVPPRDGRRFIVDRLRVGGAKA